MSIPQKSSELKHNFVEKQIKMISEIYEEEIFFKQNYFK